MSLRDISWKNAADVIGAAVLVSIILNGQAYYHSRYEMTLSIIPEWVNVQAARPYLIGAIVSLVSTVVGFPFYYYFAKYKLIVVLGVANLIFHYVNLNIIGERW